MDVADFAIGPGIGDRLGQAHHVLAVGGDLPAQEGRLHQSPLPQPQRARAGYEAVAEESANDAVAPVFLKVVCLGDEHLTNQVRVVEQPDLQPAMPEQSAVTVFTSAAGIKPEQVPLHLREMAEKEAALRAGGKHYLAHKCLDCCLPNSSPTVQRRQLTHPWTGPTISLFLLQSFRCVLRRPGWGQQPAAVWEAPPRFKVILV